MGPSPFIVITIISPSSRESLLDRESDSTRVVCPTALAMYTGKPLFLDTHKIAATITNCDSARRETFLAGWSDEKSNSHPLDIHCEMFANSKSQQPCSLPVEFKKNASRPYCGVVEK